MALHWPPDLRQFCEIPKCIGYQESPDAGHYQIAILRLQQVGSDACDKHKQKGDGHELKSEAGIMWSPQAEQKE